MELKVKLLIHRVFTYNNYLPTGFVVTSVLLLPTTRSLYQTETFTEYSVCSCNSSRVILSVSLSTLIVTILSLRQLVLVFE